MNSLLGSEKAKDSNPAGYLVAYDKESNNQLVPFCSLPSDTSEKCSPSLASVRLGQKASKPKALCSIPTGNQLDIRSEASCSLYSHRVSGALRNTKECSARRWTFVKKEWKSPFSVLRSHDHPSNTTKTTGFPIGWTIGGEIAISGLASLAGPQIGLDIIWPNTMSTNGEKTRQRFFTTWCKRCREAPNSWLATSTTMRGAVTAAYSLTSFGGAAPGNALRVSLRGRVLTGPEFLLWNWAGTFYADLVFSAHPMT